MFAYEFYFSCLLSPLLSLDRCCVWWWDGSECWQGWRKSRCGLDKQQKKRKTGVSCHDHLGGLLAPHTFKFLTYEVIAWLISIFCRSSTVLNVGCELPLMLSVCSCCMDAMALEVIILLLLFSNEQSHSNEHSSVRATGWRSSLRLGAKNSVMALRH